MAKINKIPEEDYRITAWNYFKLHANQRITMFRFYIIFFSLFALVVGHLISEFHFKSSYQETVVIILCVVFILITIIFWCLDRRNRYLIHNSEEYFFQYEKIFENNAKQAENLVLENRFLKIINTASVFTRENKDSKDGLCKFRHTFCFGIIYIIGILLSIIFIGLSVYSHYNHNDNVYYQVHILNSNQKNIIH